MNFIMKLFDSKKHNIICTIINRLFKKRYYVFYIIDEKNIVVEICVRILFHYIFRIHELFSFIISNRDFQFVNTIWKFFCKKLNIKNKLSIAFYSKTNDQTKRINQNIETRFWYYCNYIQNNWTRWIDILKFVDNDDFFATIELTFFFVNKKYHSRMIFEFDIINYESIKKRLLTKKIENINTKIKRIINYVKKHVINIVKRIIARVNQYRKFIEFEIKNYVWLNRRNIKIVRFFW